MWSQVAEVNLIYVRALLSAESNTDKSINQQKFNE